MRCALRRSMVAAVCRAREVRGAPRVRSAQQPPSPRAERAQPSLCSRAPCLRPRASCHCCRAALRQRRRVLAAALRQLDGRRVRRVAPRRLAAPRCGSVACGGRAGAHRARSPALERRVRERDHAGRGGGVRREPGGVRHTEDMSIMSIFLDLCTRSVLLCFLELRPLTSRPCSPRSTHSRDDAPALRDEAPGALFTSASRSDAPQVSGVPGWSRDHPASSFGRSEAA